MIQVSDRPMIAIGLGGIAAGWLPAIMYYCDTGVLPFPVIWLIDGKRFRADNASRQHFLKEDNKAAELCRLWGRLYPKVTMRYRPEFVTRENVAELILDPAVVLLAPDNHATRRIVSDYVETLDDCLLISGGNDAIDEKTGKDGTEGAVLVHFRVAGQNLTPPITRHHPEIAQPADQLPNEVGCSELVHSQPQLAATNFLVGQNMAELLYRYCCLPDAEATEVVERWVNSRTRTQVDYELAERPVV